MSTSAPQSGSWHLGDVPSGEPRFDPEQVDELVSTIRRHNGAWRAWFADHALESVDVVYESVVADPGGAVGVILDAIGVDIPRGWAPDSRHRRQADAISADWIQRYHAARHEHC